MGALMILEDSVLVPADQVPLAIHPVDEGVRDPWQIQPPAKAYGRPGVVVVPVGCVAGQKLRLDVETCDFQVESAPGNREIRVANNQSPGPRRDVFVPVYDEGAILREPGSAPRIRRRGQRRGGDGEKGKLELVRSRVRPFLPRGEELVVRLVARGEISP